MVVLADHVHLPASATTALNDTCQEPVKYSGAGYICNRYYLYVTVQNIVVKNIKVEKDNQLGIERSYRNIFSTLVSARTDYVTQIRYKWHTIVSICKEVVFAYFRK